MDNQEKAQGLNIVMHGITINGPMFDIHDNHSVVIQSSTGNGDDKPPVAKHDTSEPAFSFSSIVSAAEACQSYFWAQSSWAVVYCVCRDHLKMTMSMSEFERRVADYPLKPGTYPCLDGTVRKALSNNNYMHSPLHRWPEGRAKILAEALMEKLAWSAS